MPSFPKPRFAFDYDAEAETARLRAHKVTRGIPAKRADGLLVATWNIANFGAQERRDQDHRLIAEILGWFDLIAIQEVRENFAPLFDVKHLLGDRYRVVFSDVAGNNERMAFLYDARKLTLLEEVGEIAIPPSSLKSVKVKGVDLRFEGFDRNPYLATFAIGRVSFLLINVHLYFGGTDAPSMGRRVLETLAVAQYAARRRKSKHAFTREVIALGDFNMPKREARDPVYRALTSRGLEVPDHGSGLGSNLQSDKHYDQVAFFPGETKNCFSGRMGVFDFDGVVFPELWERNGQKAFNAYLRYHLSDHRPLWMELNIPQ
ncbi:MAG: endonuclease/exonuclease/phosphatase family protein [Gemmatimonadota bacterium]|nr:endonuclease/exonuclease/phosphatase family protein [Gemmatimonadota bacterium]